MTKEDIDVKVTAASTWVVRKVCGSLVELVVFAVGEAALMLTTSDGALKIAF